MSNQNGLVFFPQNISQSKQPLSLRVRISELLLYMSYEAANPFCDTYLRLSSALSSLIFHLFSELDVIFQRFEHAGHRLGAIMLTEGFYSYAQYNLEYRIIHVESYIVINLHFGPLGDLQEANPPPISCCQVYFSTLINDLQNDRSRHSFFFLCF